MTSVTSLRIEHCGPCGGKSLHGPDGCIPCKKQQIVAPAKIAPEKCSTHRRRSAALAALVPPPTTRPLTPLQVDIAGRFGDGMKLGDIAEQLGLAKSKVNNQMQKAKDRLDVPSRAAVIAHVRELKSKADAT